MTPYYDVPGVYIEEVTGPGVIAGVSTSTAAFIGPALRGQLDKAKRISNFEEFLREYAVQHSDGRFDPYISNAYYMAFAVRGFFDNGGRQAYILRVGSGRATVWEVKNKNQTGEPVFRLQAKDEGKAGNNIKIQVMSDNATGSSGVRVATASALVAGVSGVDVSFANVPPFRPGDIVTKDESAYGTVMRIQGNTLQLDQAIANLSGTDTLLIANLKPDRVTFRMENTDELYAGTVVKISGKDTGGTSQSEYAVLDRVDPAGFVTLYADPKSKRTVTFDLTQAVPVLISQEFRVVVTPPVGLGSAEPFKELSLDPAHPNYVFNAVNSAWVQVVPALQPPVAALYPDRLVDPPSGQGNLSRSVNGRDDDPSTLTSQDYQRGLDALREMDGVNIVCIPDAASHKESITIQKAMRDHCLSLQDRFAILDTWPRVEPSGQGSVEEQRQQLTDKRGFAALYYPWLVTRDPNSHASQPLTILVPPSGHIAGVYARTDNERGVHKAPANTEVRGVLGIERILGDGQQGPLNLEGINVLRIFPGQGQVTVWGARTTVDPTITDWVYVSTRRLLLYIEESIQEGIRWAVFEPNNLQLWQKLKRTITEFLTRVWRDGALFGETADKAFYVRIDEGLNPDSTRALGRLYIEIGVRPAYPAEFIIVRIGLWQGGAAISEG